MGPRGRILVVDDSRVVRAVVAEALRRDYDVDEAPTGADALRMLAAGGHDVVVTDLSMPGFDGFEVMREVKRRSPDVEVIVLTGTHAGSADCAVRALRLGAHDYLAKAGCSGEEVLLTVARAVEKKRLKEANRRLLAELDALSRRDALTGIANRRQLDEDLAREVARARRHGHPLSLAVFDLDHFKAVNDTFGHAAGDRVLCAFARVAEATLRGEDRFYRYGGEEFVALLPETDVAGALTAATRIVAATAGTPLAVAGSTLRITVSAGVAGLGATPDAASFFVAADRALYAAKQQGRNRALADLGPRRPRPRRRRASGLGHGAPLA